MLKSCDHCNAAMPRHCGRWCNWCKMLAEQILRDKEIGSGEIIGYNIDPQRTILEISLPTKKSMVDFHIGQEIRIFKP